MSEGDKQKPPNPGVTRPAQPQATWPLPGPIPDFGQWPQQMFWPPAQWQAAISYHPAYQQMYLQQAASAPAAQSMPLLPSPRSKDDSVKVVKPKDSFVRGIHSPAGIQSPKPNSPGFLLGASKGVGGRAFSVYTSRSETPASGNQSASETGVDLTQKSSRKSSNKSKAESTEKDKKDDRPVGVAVARQRSAADPKPHDAETVVVSSSTSTAASTAVTTSTSTSQAVTAPVNSQWPSFPTMPYMANPYQHYAIAAQPTMYMMPAHRPMFPNQGGVAPSYIPVPPQQVMIPELTVKTSQTQVKAHASTSPNKPISTANSPKSPLDKAREKLNEINQRRGSSSRQPSPSMSEAKSMSSESTEKTAEGTETKPCQNSAIISNTQCMNSPESGDAKPVPAKKEKKEKQPKAKRTNITKASSKVSPSKSTFGSHSFESAEKGSRLKQRRSAAVSPSAADAAISSLETLPANPKPLIAPAKFKPETNSKPIKEDPPSPTFTGPLATLKRSLAQVNPKAKRTRSKDSSDISNTWSLTTSRLTSVGDASHPGTDFAKSQTNQEETASKKSKGRRGVTTPIRSLSAVEPLEEVKVAVGSTGKSKQLKGRRQKRRSTESSSSIETTPTSAPLTLPIPVDVQNKEYIWSENAFDPIIVKHNHQVYDICEDDDLKQLESKLKLRLKQVSKQIQSHESYLKADSSGAFPLLLQSISAAESHDTPLSPDKLKSSFSVRSDSHPSLKMKAAAKAKSRASQDEKHADPPASPKKEKSMVPLTPISIPDTNLGCRRLTKKELLTTDSLILTCIEGLFYESRIKPISPPDLYGVAIDGERQSSKPRIFTEEELLNHTYTNHTPTQMAELAIGSRVCAYWSDMISHLYPGKVTEFYPAKNSNAKDLIDIEFDDGDSGKFPLYQIRMLPQNLPHIDYDTSNVIPGGRRRRNVVPAAPPIMTTPPNRSRLSRSVIPEELDSPQPKKKKVPEKSSKKADLEAEVFDQSTDDEMLEGEEKLVGSGWSWVGSCTRKPTRGRGVRMEYKAACKDGETISLGNFVEVCPPKQSEMPYIAEIQSLWSKNNGEMNVTVKWFYHPEELEVKGVSLPKHKGALFRTEHSDTILVESVKHKCEVHSHETYVKKRLHLRTVAEKKKNDQFYIAGIYDPGHKVVTARYY